MSGVIDNIDRIAPARRPAEPVVGYHTWTNLLFVHWRISADDIADLVPAALSIDTYGGSAWVGLVAFFMSGVRPRWFPALPGISSFCETNVRTYVHLGGRDPGVWFFSLDADSSLAVRIARWRWHLNYFRSEMELDASNSRVRYASKRLGPNVAGARTDIEAEVGELIDPGDARLAAGQAAPGTLEHFLAERYVLYAQGKRGQLFRGRVHHRPYPLRRARLLRCEQSLLQAAGIPQPGEPDHVLFSDGLDVDIFALRGIRP